MKSAKQLIIFIYPLTMDNDNFSIDFSDFDDEAINQMLTDVSPKKSQQTGNGDSIKTESNPKMSRINPTTSLSGHLKEFTYSGKKNFYPTTTKIKKEQRNPCIPKISTSPKFEKISKPPVKVKKEPSSTISGKKLNGNNKILQDVFKDSNSNITFVDCTIILNGTDAKTKYANMFSNCSGSINFTDCSFR